MPINSLSKNPIATSKDVPANQLNVTDTEPKKQTSSILSKMNGVNNSPSSFSVVGNKNNSILLPYPKIRQFCDVVRKVSNKAPCSPELDSRRTVSFHGTVKLHGTNGAVAHDYSTGNTWAQSRNMVLDAGVSDNKNFAAYVNSESLRPVFNKIFNTVDEFRHDGESRAAVYGEWCGKGIQKNVAVSDLPPRFVVFNIGFFNDADKCRWLKPAEMHRIIEESRGGEWSSEAPIFSSEDFKTWDITIDFAKQSSIKSASDKLSEYTLEVEDRCPVGEKFGKLGIGEGIVWKGQIQNNKNSKIHTDDLMFKVKGPKHCETNSKTVAPVHVEKVDTVEQFIEKVVTKNRLENVLSKLLPSEENAKNFCQKVKADVFSEENLLISGNKLNRRSIAVHIDKLASTWFLNENKISKH